MSPFWIVFIVVCSLAFLAILAYFVINLCFYKISLSKKNLARNIIQRTMQENLDKFKIDLSWFDKYPSESLYIKSEDGLKLKGNFFKQKDSKNLAIICHGYGAHWKEMMTYAKYFYDKGFSLLLPEMRAHGESEGKMIGMGWPDRLDIKKWIDKMLEIDKDFKIVLYGLSMGASTVCMTVGEDLPDNVSCAIVDCGYANAYEQFEFVSHRMKVIKPSLVMKIYNNFLKVFFGINLKEYSAENQLKKAKIPMLFIHGDADEFVPYENLEKLYSAHPISKHKYKHTVVGAGHAMAYPMDEEGYKKQLDIFLDKEFYKKH